MSRARKVQIYRKQMGYLEGQMTDSVSVGVGIFFALASSELVRLLLLRIKPTGEADNRVNCAVCSPVRMRMDVYNAFYSKLMNKDFVVLLIGHQYESVVSSFSLY